MQRVFITGTAGFIGFHLARSLLEAGSAVTGYDAMTDYYDPALKWARHDLLTAYPGFTAHHGSDARLEDAVRLEEAMAASVPEVVIHLAAQAGVRYSLEAPRAYLDTNITGSFNILEAAQKVGPAHLLMASTSSVYGANTAMPYRETDRTDSQMSFYAASKRATEAMAHAVSHLHGLPVTMFRFFTVYGPWGRPDMALFKFTRAILRDEPIDLYNHGDMYRDFTYIDDLVRAVCLLIPTVPPGPEMSRSERIENDSLSPVAPFRVVNIGNSTKIRLEDFVAAIEAATGRPARRNPMPMQPGDVPATWADASLLTALTGYHPQTEIEEGVAEFVRWFRTYHAM